MISEGTVIRATLLASDLIPAFLDVLREEAPAKAAAIVDEYGPVWIETRCAVHGMEYPTETDSNLMCYLMDDLFCAMEDLAPEGLLFGAHEGDGSDFGFWAVEDDAP